MTTIHQLLTILDTQKLTFRTPIVVRCKASRVESVIQGLSIMGDKEYVHVNGRVVGEYDVSPEVFTAVHQRIRNICTALNYKEVPVMLEKIVNK